MRIYTCIRAVFFLPLLIKIIVNVRSSARRIQQQSIDVNTNGNNNQLQPKLGRREISLMTQMIFMFSMFLLPSMFRSIQRKKPENTQSQL